MFLFRSFVSLAAGLLISASVSAAPVQLVHGGITLTGDLTLADGKTVADGVALITHGTLGHNGMDIVKTLQSNLEESDISTLAINLSLDSPARTFMVDCKQEHRHKHQDAMAEIAAWVSWLKSQGANKVHLIGHSRGSNQTARYASEQAAEIVDKVVLIAPPTWHEAATVKSYENRFNIPLAKVLAQANALKDKGQEDALMLFTGFLYCANAEVSAASFLSYYTPDKRLNTPNLLAALPQKTLIIAGNEDKVIGDLIPQIGKMDLPSNVALKVVDGADHFFLDFFADDLAEMVTEFLAEE